jgi:hypothetical protein
MRGTFGGAGALGLLLAECPDEAVDACFEVREEVEVLDAAGHRGRKFTVIEAEGDDEDIVLGDAGSAFEGEAEFGLKGAAFADGAAAEAGQEVVGGLDGAFDGAGPVLAGEEFFAVEPRVEALFEEGVVEFEDGADVFGGVGKEDATAAGGGELDAAAWSAFERAEAVDFDAGAFGEALADDAGELAAERGGEGH